MWSRKQSGRQPGNEAREGIVDWRREEGRDCNCSLNIQVRKEKGKEGRKSRGEARAGRREKGRACDCSLTIQMTVSIPHSESQQSCGGSSKMMLR